MYNQKRFDRRPQFRMTVDNTLQFYKKDREACINKTIELISLGDISNESFGCMSFQEDTCPKGLRDIHIVYCEDGEFTIVFSQKKIIFQDRELNTIWPDEQERI